MKVYQCRNLIVKGESEEAGNLWLGDFQSARTKKQLKKDQIYAVVTAGLGMKISYTQEIKHKMLPLYDCESENIQKYFNSSYEFIDQCLKKGNVLIHCYAGISRSTTILTAYLMRKNQWGYRETLSMIKKIRFVIGPNKGFINQLRKFQANLKNCNQNTDNETKQEQIPVAKAQSKDFVEGFLGYKRDKSTLSKPNSKQTGLIRPKTIGKNIQRV